MGLKLIILIFILILLIVNVIVFLFVRGINVIDKARTAVLGFIGRYFPVSDPLLIYTMVVFVGIIVVGIVLAKIFGKSA